MNTSVVHRNTFVAVRSYDHLAHESQVLRIDKDARRCCCRFVGTPLVGNFLRHVSVLAPSG